VARQVDYVAEPVPGISAARNRALTESADSRLLVFIDDDERPSTDWLALLLRTWRVTSPAAVVGPVVSSFEVEPEPWILEGRFFTRKRPATGSIVETAATNNLLLDLSFVREHAIRFDDAFGLSGGDDTMFTRELSRAGGVIVVCDEAVVVDVVPQARISRAWVTKRAMSSGNSWSVTSVKLSASTGARLRTRGGLTLKGGIRLIGGAARFAAGAVTNRRDLRARGVRTVARGTGMLLGAWGYKYLEYRRSGN
jgi:glycosyltransferase involved in cell wall biosynthesis